MAADIIAFRDPYAPLEGAARDAALELCREVCREVAFRAVCDAFTKVCRGRSYGKLGIDDVLPVFVEAMRRELSKAGIPGLGA